MHIHQDSCGLWIFVTAVLRSNYTQHNVARTSDSFWLDNNTKTAAKITLLEATGNMHYDQTGYMYDTGAT